MSRKYKTRELLNSSSPGFPREWFVNEPEWARCTICLGIWNNPFQCIQDGTTNCLQCIQRCIENDLSCVGCKKIMVYEENCVASETNINTNVNTVCASIVVKNLIATMPVKCSCFDTSPDSWCGWTGDITKRDTTYCEFRQFECPRNGCDQKISLRTQDQHDTECKYRLVSCMHCEEQINYSEMNTHLQECSERPWKCDTCDFTTQHSASAQHLCPNVEVDCTLFQNGCCVATCSGRVLRKDYNSHVISAASDPSLALKIVHKMAELSSQQHTPAKSIASTLVSNQKKRFRSDDFDVDVNENDSGNNSSASSSRSNSSASNISSISQNSSSSNELHYKRLAGGDEYKGELNTDGEMHGQGVYRSIKGRYIYEGGFKNGLRNGFGILRFESGNDSDFIKNWTVRGESAFQSVRRYANGDMYKVNG